MKQRQTMRRINMLGAGWGIIGVSLIIGSAIIRVVPHVFDAFRVGLNPMQYVVLVVWCIFMLIGEGYRGFQKQFSPRVAARTWHLMQHGRPFDLLLAPLYCIGYYHATRRRKITSWSLTAGITLIIAVVVHFSQPWRGIIDAGVVLGLAYGLVWVYICLIQTFRSRSYIVDPEVDLLPAKE